MNQPVSRAFTLIELLVVISIIGVLIGVLIPSLSAARDQAKLTTCQTRLHQLGIATQAYAVDFSGRIPRGPSVPWPYGPAYMNDKLMMNQIWIGASKQYNSHGVLLTSYLQDKVAMFDPGETDPAGTLQQIDGIESSTADAFSSYNYRQLQDITDDRIDNLGFDAKGLAATCLYGCNQEEGPAPANHTTHAGNRVNLGFADGHGAGYSNSAKTFTYRAQDYPPTGTFPDSAVKRGIQIMVNADFSLLGDPAAAPQLP